MIVDGFENDLYIARSIADAPEIDCNVYVKSKNNLNIGDIIQVKINKTEYGDLFGEYMT